VLTISQRLQKAKRQSVKIEVAQDWAKNWQAEMFSLILDLEKAVSSDDYDAMCRATGQIKAVTIKRFDALPKVLNAIALAENGGDHVNTQR
jgi:lactate dehydrogenase-like 2-hydroxyacid dehydrogenase